ncbi:MAG: OmpA family protein [Acidobacteriia bacterium]|nr:OmpA family protein [Terriglobia bacterium]
MPSQLLAAAPKKSRSSSKGAFLVLGVIAFFILAIVSIYFGLRSGKRADATARASKKIDAAGRTTAAWKSSNNSSSAANTPISTYSAPKIVQVSGPETERTMDGPEADLLVRTGDINNLGFGWPQGFDPFSGESTPPHSFPWTPPPGSPDGTDRLMIGSSVTQMDYGNKPHDGYSTILRPCCGPPSPKDPPSQARLDSMPRPITLDVGALPAKIDAVLFQIFVDDFQAPVWHSHFQVTLNGTRIPSFEDAINALDQTGPIGKLVSLRLLPEYWPLLQSGSVKLLIDDPTTHVPDGYAIDFVRILVNPHKFKYEVTLMASVVDADKHSPIAGATVTAALASAATDQSGKSTLHGVPAGLVAASASAPGYDTDSVTVDLVAGQTGKAEFKLHRHEEGTAALEESIAQTGSARVYGIHFDQDSAKLRPDSAPALAAVLGLINNRPGSRWMIAGHTDNQGAAARNQPLSEARAASVVAWLTAHGVAANQLVPQGFGASQPVADNATANGKALNRRVEIAPANEQR